MQDKLEAKLNLHRQAERVHSKQTQTERSVVHECSHTKSVAADYTSWAKLTSRIVTWTSKSSLKLVMKRKPHRFIYLMKSCHRLYRTVSLLKRCVVNVRVTVLNWNEWIINDCMVIEWKMNEMKLIGAVEPHAFDMKIDINSHVYSGAE